MGEAQPDRRGIAAPRPTCVGLYQATPVTLHPYDARAADVARIVAEMITAVSPSLQVEHIGSTAVPGCTGKGIVDLMVLYPEGQLELAKQALAVLGFQHQTTGHIFGEDRPMRVGALHHAGRTFGIHAHVLLNSSPEAADLRSFRDRLRADPQLQAAYVALKQSIVATGVTDRAEYTRRKGEFIVQATFGS